MLQRIIGFIIGFIIGIVVFQSVVFAQAPVRLKDICRVSDVRPNQLVGYGIVVGLNGTGDSEDTFFTVQSIVNMLQQFGMSIPREKVTIENVAAVMVTAELPAFSHVGDKVDVIVSAIGDASDLTGGILLQTPLMGADKNVYVVAQGAISLGGEIGARAAGRAKVHPTVGRIPQGGIVEKDITCPIVVEDKVSLVLKDYDFTTVSRIVKAINDEFEENIATGVDASKIYVTIPDKYKDDIVGFISMLEGIMIVPDVLAKVVINERTGTVVMGENICIMPVAISHKNIYLVVKGEEKKEIEEETEKEKEGKVKETEEEREIVGPMLPAIPPVDTSIIAEALNAIKVPPEQIGTAIEIIRKKYEDKMKAERVGVSPTVAEEKSKIGTPEKEKGVEVQGNMVFFPTKVRVGDIVKGLNAVGATPQDIIAVLQAIKAAGALYAELVIM